MQIVINGKVDDEKEAQNILSAVEVALVPFEELELECKCYLSQTVETPEVP